MGNRLTISMCFISADKGKTLAVFKVSGHGQTKPGAPWAVVDSGGRKVRGNGGPGNHPAGMAKYHPRR
ncbi:hypothetical protein DESC_460057 [Desulfosarcina cetonica]|nr:hypothetical protein DESC_460057 [Desulfosarcina cetonica]